MGGAHSIPLCEVAKAESSSSGWVWYSIGVSQFCNFVQEARKAPKEYVVYDTRSERQFLTCCLVGAVWAWELNISNPAAGVVRRKKDGRPHALSNLYFLKSLRMECASKTVLVFGDGVKSFALREFLTCLDAAAVPARMVLVLRCNVGELHKSQRYAHMFSDSDFNPAQPIEVLPPATSTKKASGGCLLLSGVDALQREWEAIARWEVNAIINLSDHSLKVSEDMNMVAFPPHTLGGTLCLEKGADAILSYLQQKRVVLVVDATDGNTWAAAACALALMNCGIAPDIVIQHLKENKPSIDSTFCNLSLSDNATPRRLKLPLIKQVFGSRSKTAVLPPEALEVALPSAAVSSQNPADILSSVFKKDDTVTRYSSGNSITGKQPLIRKRTVPPPSAASMSKRKSSASIQSLLGHRPPAIILTPPVAETALKTPYWEYVDSVPEGVEIGVSYTDEDGNEYHYEVVSGDEGRCCTVDEIKPFEDDEDDEL